MTSLYIAFALSWSILTTSYILYIRSQSSHVFKLWPSHSLNIFNDIYGLYLSISSVVKQLKYILTAQLKLELQLNSLNICMFITLSSIQFLLYIKFVLLYLIYHFWVWTGPNTDLYIYSIDKSIQNISEFSCILYSMYYIWLEI